MDGASHLLVANAASGALYRIKLADGSAEKVADGLGAVSRPGVGPPRPAVRQRADDGRSALSPGPATSPSFVAKGFQDAGGLCLDPTGKRLLVPDPQGRHADGRGGNRARASNRRDAAGRPCSDVAFPDLQWTGWKGETDDGKPNPLRPIVLTHAGDGSNRVFVATEQGVVHVFPNDPKATKTKVFLDIQDRVSYDDSRTRRASSASSFIRNTRRTASSSSSTRPKRRNGPTCCRASG